MSKRNRIAVIVSLTILVAGLVIDAIPSARIHAVSLFYSDLWPLESGNRHHFGRAREHFDYLAETMLSNPDYSAIYAGGKSLFKETCVHTQENGCPASANDDLIRHMRKSAAFAVMNHGNTVIFGIGDTVIGHTIFTYGVARIEPETDRFPSCRDVSPEEIEFICVLPMDGVWHLQYSTYTDPGVSP